MTVVVYGCDVSTQALALAIARPVGHVCITVPFAGKARGATRLADAHARLHQWLPSYADTYGPPAAVFVEQPFGRFPKASLEQMVGVVLCALGQVFDCPVVELPVTRWKQLSVGAGNATKELTMRWAREQGYKGASEDEADALGVCVAGQFLLDRELEDAA